MRGKATEFRRQLFQFLKQTLQGETVEAEHRGEIIHVAAGDSGSKLARARRQQALLVDPDAIIEIDLKLMARLESEWRKETTRL